MDKIIIKNIIKLFHVFIINILLYIRRKKIIRKT